MHCELTTRHSRSAAVSAFVATTALLAGALAAAAMAGVELLGRSVPAMAFGSVAGALVLVALGFRGPGRCRSPSRS